MKHLLPLGALCAILSAPAGIAADITLIDADNLAWETTPEGVSFAALQGDRFQGAYQAMVRLPARTISPAHVKTATMFGVVLRGEMTHYGKDADPASAHAIGPGAFYRIPGGLAHVSACVSSVPCVTYLYQDAAFDFVPVAQ